MYAKTYDIGAQKDLQTALHPSGLLTMFPRREDDLPLRKHKDRVLAYLPNSAALQQSNLLIQRVGSCA